MAPKDSPQKETGSSTKNTKGARDRKYTKYLLRKVSGSKARYTYKPDYRDERHRTRQFGSELPLRQTFKRKGISYLDTSLVKQWLYSQVGKSFDDVYSEFLKRLQPKYREQYKDCIYHYVVKANDVVIESDGSILELGMYRRRPFKIYAHYKPFYICPETKLLKHINPT